MTEQRKWPDNWEWVDKEERTPATEAEAAAMVAKIEDRIRKTEAAAKAEAEMVAKIEDRLRKTEAAAKADPRDLIERVAREIVAKHYPEHAAEIMSGKYKGRRMAIALDALDYRCPPDDVEKAARWIFDNSDGWTEDAKANAQKLAEYALRGKQ